MGVAIDSERPRAAMHAVHRAAWLIVFESPRARRRLNLCGMCDVWADAGCGAESFTFFRVDGYGHGSRV